jgi:hypothetical protein
VLQQDSHRIIHQLWLVSLPLPQTEMPASQADLDDPRYAKLRYHPGGLRAILTASTLKARVGQPLCIVSLSWQTIQEGCCSFSLLGSSRRLS